MMNIRHKFVSFSLLIISLFFIQSSLASATIITCPGGPTNNTLNWSTVNPGSCSNQSGGSANAACNFTAYAGGSKSIPLGTSCSASLSCPEASPSTVSDSIIYDASKVWNGSSCVTPTACNLPWGGSIASGQSATAYQAVSVTYPATCTNETRTCNNGTLSGSYTNPSCSTNAPTASFTASSPIAYGSRSTLTWNSTGATSCTAGGPWSNSGTLSGSGLTNPLTSDTSFTFQCTGPGGTSPLQTVTVSVNPPVACSLPASLGGGTTPSGSSLNAYQVPNATPPAICSSFIQTRSCFNGTLSGSYTNSGCGGCTVSTADNYDPSATTNNGTCVTCTPVQYYSASTNTCIARDPQVSSLIAEPRTASLGSASSLSWDIKYPDTTCSLTAATVCVGACNASQLASAASLNSALKSPATTDSNDINGASRPMTSALQTLSPTSITDAKGKKTLQIKYTTDFTLKCGVSSTITSKKVRFLITTNHEG